LDVPATGPVSVVWSPFTFVVPIAETGLPDGVRWWGNASGSWAGGFSTTLDVRAPNGSTPYSVGSLYEFVATPSEGTLEVIGGQFAPVAVQFSYRPTFIAGTVSPATAEVVIGGMAQVVDGGSFNDSVIPGTYTLVA